MAPSRLSPRVWIGFGVLVLVVVGVTAAGAVWYGNRLRAHSEPPAPEPVAVAGPPVSTSTPPATAPEPAKSEPAPGANTTPAAGAPLANPPLREVAIAAAPAAPAESSPVVYLEPPPLEGLNRPVTGLLGRELHRQAVLLAARDELGLTTRDGVLGELPPANLPPHQRLIVSIELAVGRPLRVTVEAGPGREVWRAEARGPAVTDELPAAAVVTAEAFSRGGYLHALRRAGWPGGRPNKIDPTGAVPSDVETWLGQMNFPAQFYALRALHAAARKTGESPGLLGALVRAYAHLGMLTDAQWGAAPWVFKARALLYAQRLVTRDPGAAWGLWHRAYAAALAGMHAAALEDLKAATAARGGAANTPDWAALADALCRFDSAKLKASFADPRLGETARVFHFLTVEGAESRSLAGKAGAAVLLKYPECDRVSDALAALGVGERAAAPSAAYRTFGERFARRVREAPGLPKAVADTLAKSPAEPDLVKALIEAADPVADPADPSWALLGRFAQEERVVQVAGRLRFLADDLNAPADEFFKSAAPLVAGHPLYPYLESHVIDPKRWPDEYRDRLRADRVPALSYRHLPIVVAQRRLGRDAATRATHVAQAHGDWLYYDSALALRASLDGQDRTPLAHRLLWVSPHAPIARAALIRSDTAIPEAMLATWEQEAQHPEIFEALAGRAFRAGRWEDVNRYFRRALELSPDVTLYRLVAEGYKARGDTAGWVATLESFLRTDDPGLDHARVRVDLAYHFLATKDYPRAHGYAEAAAESGAPFALRCAARCADAAGEWAKAEAHARRLSEQFPDALAAWLIWCHRTGKGDAGAAAKLVEDRLGRVTGNPTADELQTAAALRALTGKVDLAPELLFAAHQRKRDDAALLLAASLSDTLKDTGSRERYLAFLTDDRSPYIAIKLFLARAQDDGEQVRPVADSAARMVRATPPGARVLACYIGGMYALRRGETKVATEYLTKAATDQEPNDTLPAALAAVALRGVGKK